RHASTSRAPSAGGVSARGHPDRALNGAGSLAGCERKRKKPEKACKPGPVGWTFAQPDGHFSRTPVTRRLKRPYPRAPRGPRFTHAPGLRPLPGSPSFLTLRRVAVSFLWHSAVGSPPLAVSQHPALRSPDFPPARVAPRRRPSDLLWCHSKSASLREKV